jgi:hypothetical protein
MLWIVVFATSRLKVMLVGPRNAPAICGTLETALPVDPPLAPPYSALFPEECVVEGDGDTADDEFKFASGGRSWRSDSVRREFMDWYRLSTCSCKRVICVAMRLNSSESLKLLEQQFGVYRHTRLRLPHR